MHRLALSLLLLTMAMPAAWSQTALPFLEIAPSELGGAGVARPDVQTFVQNPALLGLSAVSTRAAASGTPTVGWLGELSYGTGSALVGGEVGPLAMGVGTAQGELVGEPRTLGDGTPYQPMDRYRALGVGVATRGPIRLAAGITGRHITTTDAPVFDGERFSSLELGGASLDVGVAASADIGALTTLPTLGSVEPALTVRAGYGQTHISGEVQYSGFGPMPLPRTAALGWSATAGLDLPTKRGSLRLAELEVAAQAERSLVRMDEQRYAGVLGGLSPLHAVAGIGDDATTGRRGVRFVLAETFAFSAGRYDGWGYDDVRSRTTEVRARGVLHLLTNALGRSVGDIGQRADLRLSWETAYAGTPDVSTRTRITLVVRP